MPAPLGSILASPKWVWPFLIVLAQQVRTLLVEYVGDVAIYITPNKLDRFDRVRNEIKQTALNVASAIFLACDPEKKDFLYDQIAVVGHSLGSVIAYDTLNQLMLNDWLSNNHLGIANRTNCLLTFGSPLDKTAFLFTIQGQLDAHSRTAGRDSATNHPELSEVSEVQMDQRAFGQRYNFRKADVLRSPQNAGPKRSSARGGAQRGGQRRFHSPARACGILEKSNDLDRANATNCALIRSCFVGIDRTIARANPFRVAASKRIRASGPTPCSIS
jgi:hypothetical protein